MDERQVRLARQIRDALENIAAEMERLRVLKEHELGVRLEDGAAGGGPYVPRGEDRE